MMSGKCLDDVNDAQQMSTLQKEVSDTTTSVSAGVPRDLIQSHISSGHSTSRISTIKENHGSCLGERSLVNKITNTIAHIHNADTRLVASDPTPSYIQFTHLQMPTYTVSNQLPTAISSTLSTGACSRQMPTSSPSSFGTFITSYQRPSPILLMPIVQSGSRIKPVSPILFVPNQNSSILIPTAVSTTLNSHGGISKSHGSSAALTREQLPMCATAEHNVNTSSNQLATPISTEVRDSVYVIMKNTDYTKQNEYEDKPEAPPPPTCTAGKSNELNPYICTPPPTCSTGKSSELNPSICTPSPVPTCSAGRTNELNPSICTPSPAPMCTGGKSSELIPSICTPSPAPTCTGGKSSELIPSICTHDPINKYCVTCAIEPTLFHTKDVIAAYVREVSKVVASDPNRRCSCPFCGVSYQCGWRLSLHMISSHLSHITSKRKSITCQHCDSSFKLDDQFSKHMHKFHPIKYCFECSFVSSNPQLLLDHIFSTHFNGYSLKINMKQRVFVSAQNIIKKLKASQQMNTLRQCPFCPFSTKSIRRFALQVHIFIRHLASEQTAEGKISCCHCPLEFQSDILYRQHIKEVHRKRGFWHCPFCPCKVKRIQAHLLEAHRSIITPTKIVFVSAQNIRKKLDASQQANTLRQCPFCPFRTKSSKRFSLLFHLFNRHLACEQTAEGKISCCHCPLQFQTDILYRQHIKMVHRKRGFWHCPFCPCKVKHVQAHLIAAHRSTIIPKHLEHGSDLSNKNLDNSMELKSTLPYQKPCLTSQAFGLDQSNDLPQNCIENTTPSCETEQTQVLTVVQRNLSLIEQKLNSSFEISETQFRGNSPSSSTENLSKLNDCTLPNIGQDSVCIPETCCICPHCNVEFHCRKDLEIHIIAEHPSCSKVVPLTVANVIQPHNPHMRDNGTSSKIGDIDTLLGNADVGRNVKPIDQCYLQAEGESGCQILGFKKCFNAEKTSHNSSNYALGEFEKNTLNGAEKKHDTSSVHQINQSVMFHQKEVIVTYMTQMFEQDLHVPSQKQQHECPLCGASYHLRWNLFLHMMTKHLLQKTNCQGQRIKCPHCSKFFLSNEKFILHLSRVHEKKDENFCPQCSFVSSTPWRFYNHFISKHFRELIEVNRNQKIFVEAEEIRKELHLNELANNFRQCPFCPFQSSANSAYQFNLRYHLFVYHLASPRTGRGKIKCCHCSKQFQSDMLYRKHIKAKHSEKGFQCCPFCPSKVKHMHRTSHFVRAHGFTIVMPNGRSEGTPSKGNNTIICNSRKINSISPNKRKNEKKTPFESVQMDNLPRKSVAMTNPSKLPSVVQVEVGSDEPMLNSNFETDKTQFHGNVSNISLGNSADFRDATLADDSQTTLSAEIPQVRYHTCPLCSEVFNKEKDLKVHLIAKHDSCISINVISLDGTRQAKSPPHEHEENTNSFGHTDVGEMVKRVDKCSKKSGSISDCQVPFKKCSTSKRSILDSSICEDGNQSLEGRKNKHAKTSIGRFSYLFYKKKEVVSNVARMSKLDSHDQHQMQKLKCPFCKSRVLYRFRWNLFRHIMSQHLSLEPDYQSQKKKCPHCNDSFLVDEPFLLHMKTVHRFIDQNFCPQCPYVGTSLRRLYGHAVSTHFKELENVDIKQVFVSAEQIMKKLKASQSVIDNKQCPFCPYTVPKNLHYQRNLQLHLFVSHLAAYQTIDRKIKCCHCSQLFDLNILYRKHVRRDHNEKGLQYCPFCPCKAKCLSTHLIEAHGSMIVIPNYSRPPNVRSIQDIAGAHSIEVPPNTISHESMQDNFDIIPFKQTMDKSKSFKYCKDGKLSIEWQDLSGAGPSSSSKFNQDKQPVKRFKTCHSNSITLQITPTLHSIANQRSADLFTAADSSGSFSKPSVSSLIGNQNISDPQEQFLAPKTKLKISLSNSEGFQVMKWYAHNQHNTKECPYCGLSVFLEEMYEHFITEHKEINTCMHCDTKFSYVGEIFDHTWLFHFKLSAQLLTTVKTRYYSPEALCLILRKALLHLQNSGETTLKQCPLCDFGCKRKIKLKKYMSYHLVLCHHASELSPQNNIQCPHCTAMFNFESAFRSHLEFDHNSSHTFHCPFCPFKCAAHRALLLHNITVIHGAQLLPELCLDVNALLREDVHVTPTNDKVVKPLKRRKSKLLAPRSTSGSFNKTVTETLNEDLYELCIDVKGPKYQAHPYELCSDVKGLENHTNPCELCTDIKGLEDQAHLYELCTDKDQSMREPTPCSSLTLEDQSMRKPAPCCSLTPEAASSFPSTSFSEVIDVEALEKQTDYPSPEMYFPTPKTSLPKCYPGKNSLITLPACTSSKNSVETIEAPSNSVNLTAPEADSNSRQVADSIGAYFSGAKSTDSTKVIFLHEKNVHINPNGAGHSPTFGCQADESQIRENHPNLFTVNHFQHADDNQVNISQNVSQITFPPEENYFACPQCCKRFSMTEDLLDHLKTEHKSCSVTDLWPSACFTLLELQEMRDKMHHKTYGGKRGKTSFMKYCASSDVMSDETHFRRCKMGSCESTSPLTDLFRGPGDLSSSETELSSLVVAPVASGAHVESTSKCQNKDMILKVEIDSPSPCPIDIPLFKVEIDGSPPSPINIPLFKLEIDCPSPCPINIPLFNNLGKDCFIKSEPDSVSPCTVDINSIKYEDVVKSEF